MGSGGSGRQIPGLRNTKRIRGSHTWARRPKDLKPDSQPEGMEVYATGRWGEGECAIPGEVCSPANGLASSRDDVMGEQKSAEGTVATASWRRPERGRKGEYRASMDKGDVDKRAEMPEDSRKVAGGTREDTEREHQMSTAAEKILDR